MKKITIILALITLIIIAVAGIAIYTSIHSNDVEKASVEASASESQSVVESASASVAAYEAESESYAAIVTSYEEQISAVYIDVSAEIDISIIEDYITALKAIKVLIEADTELSDSDMNSLVAEIENQIDISNDKITIIKADISAALGK